MADLETQIANGDDKQLKNNKKKIKNKGKRNARDENDIDKLLQQCSEEIDWDSIAKFSEFPLSFKTQKGRSLRYRFAIAGLTKEGYVSPTVIQRQGIALALRGLDVLGAAKTGSGKTLAFLIPVLELLYKEKFTQMDGLGALIISPTRELAYQIFEVLRKIGRFHTLSAGLVIGGKSIEEEQSRILTTNIIICTPGRLLQHMDETPNFDCNNLRILVLDEADRILDLGFSQTMNAIIENLPPDRQTLLYSATQTKSVKDLARLSLKDPEYIAVHEKASHSTPKTLEQYYAVCDLAGKMNFLYSFIKNHLKCKIIVFMSSCKQVKFTYEVFRRMRPGIPLMALYGKQKQPKRVGIYEQFCRKSNALLFATDIAARGLDFPEVHWVVQLDCPEDASTYIHRVGRTARLEKDGKALLILLKSEEEEMLKELQGRKIPIQEIRPDPKKIQNMEKRLASFCAQSQEMKHWAQRSIVSYVRSVFLQSNKKIFDIHKLSIEEYAKSIGLLAPPRIRFMKKLEKTIGNAAKEARKDLAVKKSMKKDSAPDEDETDDSDNEVAETETVAKSNKKMINNGTFRHVSRHDDDYDDVLVLKSKQSNDDDDEIYIELNQEIIEDERKNKARQTSKVSQAKKIKRKGIKLNTKVVFGEDGEAFEVKGPVKEAGDADEDEAGHLKPVDIKSFKKSDVGGIDLKRVKAKLGRTDKLDRQAERTRIKRKHKEMKQKSKGDIQDIDENMAVLSMPEAGNTLHEFNFSEDQGQPEEEEPAINFKPPKNKRRKKSEESEEENNAELDDLKDDEELALHLLSGV
eukprot:gene511-1158_t